MRDDAAEVPRIFRCALHRIVQDGVRGCLPRFAALQAAFESDTMKEQAQSVLAFETVGARAHLYRRHHLCATDLFTQILEEEGIDASSLGLGDEDEDEDRWTSREQRSVPGIKTKTPPVEKTSLDRR